MIKNKEATKEILIKAVDDLITEEGFEKLGINAVAARAGVSKMLIYRYFGSLEELIAAYIKQHDFWINLHPTLPSREELGDFLKQMFRNQINLLRDNYTLRRLYRWELSSNNPVIRQLRDERELKGKQLTDMIIKTFDFPPEEVTLVATLLASSITYLALLAEFSPYYNGIAIQQDKGWEQIDKGISKLIDEWLIKQENRK
ncbi:MAG: TetR/AcrR family transcriptional regulator [Tannerellaceae bacterium]|nr:TetR/AcrR family transcriptional regulator [Tannerellaceae bacterium]